MSDSMAAHRSHPLGLSRHVPQIPFLYFVADRPDKVLELLTLLLLFLLGAQIAARHLVGRVAGLGGGFVSAVAVHDGVSMSTISEHGHSIRCDDRNLLTIRT